MTEPDKIVDWDKAIVFIRYWLQKGELREIARQVGYSPDHSYKILSGATKNHPFIELCYKKALERAKLFIRFEQERIEVEQKIS